VAVTATRLVRGRDYPATFAEFRSWFSDEDACLALPSTPKPAKVIISGLENAG
jgi:hypothetical protein